ncbi:MAG: two-component system sensor histidine kinase CreC [Verrucomicrobiota bacterium]
MSLTIRLLISFALMALAAYFALLDPVLDRVERQYLEAAEEPMVDVAQILGAALSDPPEGKLTIPLSLRSGMSEVKKREFSARIYSLLKEEVLMDFYVTDSNGRIIYDSANIAQFGDDYSMKRDVRFTLRGEYGARSTRLDEEDWSSSIMYVGAPIFSGDQIIGVCSVYKPQRSMLVFIEETKQRLIYLGLLTGLLIFLFGYLLSRWVTLPLRKLTDYAAAVSRGERPPSPKLPGYHLRLLGKTTETMRNALENRKYVESYVQSLTHEMKSPVAGIRGAAELLHEELTMEKREQFLGNIQSESERLLHLIDQLLALASIESRTELGSPRRIRLDLIVNRVIDYLESGAQKKEVTLGFQQREETYVCGEEFLLETAISNLLQNAINFSPEGGRIDLSIQTEENRVVLAITDEGEGIPAFAKDKIFERFYSLPRPGTDRKSSGLGLCFAREATILHSGTLEIENRKHRSGVSVRLSLPKEKF